MKDRGYKKEIISGYHRQKKIRNIFIYKTHKGIKAMALALIPVSGDSAYRI
jgi:hypothetical protein